MMTIIMQVNLNDGQFRDSYGNLHMSYVQEAVAGAMEELSAFEPGKHRVLTVRVKDGNDCEAGWIRIGDDG